MNKKTNSLFIFTTLLLISLLAIVTVLDIFYTTNNKTIDIKKSFVNIVGLPDLAISTETNYIRHRSLSNISTIFSDGPEHTEYATASFITNVAKISHDDK